MKSFIRVKILISSQILGRVACPIELLCFKFVSHRLLLPLFDGIHKKLRKLAGLFVQLENSPANELQYVHVSVFIPRF